MPPHLHPRSRLTTSLFTTALAVSFLVVGAPHILPCPVDTRTYADAGENGAGRPQRRRRRKIESIEENGNAPQLGTDGDIMQGKRECPVPKPGGLVGQILGFKTTELEQPLVAVRPIQRGPSTTPASAARAEQDSAVIPKG